jgi:hypothetical protein
LKYDVIIFTAGRSAIKLFTLELYELDYVFKNAIEEFGSVILKLKTAHQ